MRNEQKYTLSSVGNWGGQPTCGLGKQMGTIDCRNAWLLKIIPDFAGFNDEFGIITPYKSHPVSACSPALTRAHIYRKRILFLAIYPYGGTASTQATALLCHADRSEGPCRVHPNPILEDLHLAPFRGQLRAHRSFPCASRWGPRSGGAGSPYLTSRYLC